MNSEMLKKRAEIIKKIRTFFDSRNYLELDTPLLSQSLIPESCLEVFQTERLFPYGSRQEKKPLWLIPSPEIYMKKIIAQEKTNVFQICKCFRNGESTGHLHHPEFTMLEYYTMNADYMDSLALTEELFASLLSVSSSVSKEQFLPFERVTVGEAFERYAGFDLFAAAEDRNKMEKEARKLGLDPAPGLPVAVLYDLIFIHAVEPKIQNEKPVALLDYPSFVPCLAKQKTKDTRERWELYYNGIELANCFSEETDTQKVKEFFLNENTEKEKNALVKHNIDYDYYKIFSDFPECSGVALGLDRLIMALTGKKTINEVIMDT